MQYQVNCCEGTFIKTRKKSQIEAKKNYCELIIIFILLSTFHATMLSYFMMFVTKNKLY